MISRWILLRQISLLGGKLRLQKSLEEHLQLPDEIAEKTFKRLWIDNGDYISVLYAGSRFASILLSRYSIMLSVLYVFVEP
jgi:hypothetical protein